MVLELMYPPGREFPVAHVAISTCPFTIGCHIQSPDVANVLWNAVHPFAQSTNP